MTQRDQLFTIKRNDVQHVYLLSTAHNGWTVEILKVRGAHERMKPNTVLNHHTYKIGADKSDQNIILLFLKKNNKVVEEIAFSSPRSCTCECSHFARWKKCTIKFRLHKFMEKVAVGLVAKVNLIIVTFCTA
jgi:hypothetical protein